MTTDIISQQQEDMISMVLKGENITTIAKKVNVTRSTIYAWLNKDFIKNEVDRRRKDIVSQGNNYILKDAKSYIDNIKALANDKSDKRVCLAANQYLLNRIYGNPTSVIENTGEDSSNVLDTNELELQLKKFKNLPRIK